MSFLALVIALLVCITIHECSHAIVANALGDPTAKREGRVSLNPLKHLDPLGTISMFILHFGWGKPVPVNDRNFENPIRDSALTALAGPISNILTAFILSIPIKYFSLSSSAELILRTIYDVSIVLAIFNFLPFPPLDGSKIIGIFVPYKYQFKYEEFLQNGVAYFLVFLLLDNFILSKYFGFSIISKIIYFFYDLISGFILINT